MNQQQSHILTWSTQDQHLPNLLGWHSLRRRGCFYSSNCHLIKREMSVPQGSGLTLNIIISLPGTLSLLLSSRSLVFGCSDAWSPYLSVWLISQAIHIEMAAIHQGYAGRATRILPRLCFNQSLPLFFTFYFFTLLSRDRFSLSSFSSFPFFLWLHFSDWL